MRHESTFLTNITFNVDQSNETLCLYKVLKQVEKENCIFIHVFHIITASLNQGCKTTRSTKTERAIGKFFACPFSSRSGHFLSPPWCLIKEYNHQKAPFGKRCLILLYLMMPTGCNDSQMSPGSFSVFSFTMSLLVFSQRSLRHRWVVSSLYLLSLICLAPCSGKLPVASVYIEDLILLEDDLGWDLELGGLSAAVVGASCVSLRPPFGKMCCVSLCSVCVCLIILWIAASLLLKYCKKYLTESRTRRLKE